MEKVLVVDDDPDVRDVLTETQKRLGYKARAAENGRVGLEAFRKDAFSVVVTDMRMPEMDGLSMLKEIKKADSKVSVVVVTGYPSVDSAVESLVEGADYYLVKPINLNDFEAKIKKALEKRKMQKALASMKTANWVMVLLIPLWIILGILLSRWM